MRLDFFFVVHGVGVMIRGFGVRFKSAQ